MIKYILATIIFTTQVYANNYLDENLHKMNWNDIEVLWLEDDQYPTYHLSVYFHAGAITDAKGKYGETELMFNQLTSGTSRYSKEEIISALEFYGASYGANVTHEYSTFSVSGLVKDMVPTMKMICHTFQKATYPVQEFKKTKKRIFTGLKNMVTNPGALASRVFRELSLQKTPYANPVGGNKKTIQSISAKNLHDKLLFFNKKVKKRIYIKGPKMIKGLKNIITKDCGWSQGSYKAKLTKVKSKIKKNNTVYLVPIPRANQAQIRVGRYLTGKETQIQHELKALGSKFIGGGFTSRLMQELRVKRGLTYSVGAYSSSQKTYGRAGISTFTKNQTIVDTLKVIKETIEKESKNISKEHFSHVKRYIKGNYLLGLESTSSFLETLLVFDHIGRDYDEIYKFVERIDEISKKQLQNIVHQLYDWDNQVKLVLGSKELAKPLKEAGYKVKILDYNEYL